VSSGDVALAFDGGLLAVIITLGVAIARDRERIARLEERTRRLLSKLNDG
jgi:hypothetical protein